MPAQGSREIMRCYVVLTFSTIALQDDACPARAPGRDASRGRDTWTRLPRGSGGQLGSLPARGQRSREDTTAQRHVRENRGARLAQGTALPPRRAAWSGSQVFRKAWAHTCSGPKRPHGVAGALGLQGTVTLSSPRAFPEGARSCLLIPANPEGLRAGDGRRQAQRPSVSGHQALRAAVETPLRGTEP